MQNIQNILAAGEGGGSSSWIIWVMVGLLAVMLIFTMIPQRRKQKKAQEKLNAIIKGDKVKTIGGLIGTVEAIDAATNSMLLNIGADEENKVLIKIGRAGIYTIIDPEAEKAALEQAKKEAEQQEEEQKTLVLSQDDIEADEVRKLKQQERDERKKEKEAAKAAKDAEKTGRETELSDAPTLSDMPTESTSENTVEDTVENDVDDESAK